MAETLNIQRGSFYVDPGSWPGGSGGALEVGQLSPTTATAGTIMRAISFPSVHVSVGAPGAGTPPEDWWMRATCNWFIWASFAFSTSVPTFGYDHAVLYVGRLTPILVASPSAPTEYYVRYEGPATGFQTKGKRRAPAGDPIVLNSGLRWEDPLGGMDTGTFTNVTVTVRTTDIGIFGEQI